MNHAVDTDIVPAGAAATSGVKALVERLRDNAQLGKHGHFYASLRRRNLHILCGVPVVVINLLLGSVFFTLLQAELPDWGKWLGALLALVAAALGGIQTFFDFKKTCAGHREVGNDYLGLARECERLLALHADGLLTLEALASELPRLNAEYADINERAEDYIVSPREYALARERLAQRAGQA
ncbi:SLATT domain-containing protein [Thalassolituus sp. LLYu03]|uniref:SLATT domain-containing protein n=1 Tax=Thalassolituus sp. LLYu03 TaxID=3421656 RepID=UPI003D2B781C